MKSDLIYEVLSVVEEIPEGRVATYGQIARLTGRDRNARMVGRILSMSAYYGQYPCHRVVNHAEEPPPRLLPKDSCCWKKALSSGQTVVWIWESINGIAENSIGNECREDNHEAV